MEAYHIYTNYTRLNGLRILLRYVMRTLGFSTGYQPADLYHAENDALRTLAIMACLTHKNVTFRILKELEHVLQMNKHRKEQNRSRGTEKSRSLHRKRPRPPSQCPHVARVTLGLAPDTGEEGRASQSLAGAVEEQRMMDSCNSRPSMPADLITFGTSSHRTTHLPLGGSAEKDAIMSVFRTSPNFSNLCLALTTLPLVQERMLSGWRTCQICVLWEMPRGRREPSAGRRTKKETTSCFKSL